MSEFPLSTLFGALAALLVLSAFFSGSETALMTLNRYRVRHLAERGHRGAILAERLLERPDRLIGLILIGNNVVNVMASMLTTVIALRLWGDSSLAAAAGVLVLVILVFSEVTPKTLAALSPETLAFPASYIYTPLLKVFYPLVWLINLIANSTLRIFGIRANDEERLALSTEELRTVVIEAGTMIPKRHQRMLLSILDLEKATVEDIMVPRNEIVGIDITDDWDTVLASLTHSQHTRLPVYEESIDNIIGIVHLRRLIGRLTRNQLTRDNLVKLCREVYYIPEGTPLNTQLLNFQRQKRRIGLVVDEYGDIQGMVTLEDILEEIVGEFTTDPAATLRDIEPQPDGSFIIDAGLNVRALNRMMGWELPTTGPKTLNGLLLEHMETIPEPGTSTRLGAYAVEVIKTQENAVRTVKISPPARRRARRAGTAQLGDR